MVREYSCKEEPKDSKCSRAVTRVCDWCGLRWRCRKRACVVERGRNSQAERLKGEGPGACLPYPLAASCKRRRRSARCAARGRLRRFEGEGALQCVSGEKRWVGATRAAGCLRRGVGVGAALSKHLWDDEVPLGLEVHQVVLRAERSTQRATR
eukprot:4894909-Pleurochrysis_carterae.AAC.1